MFCLLHIMVTVFPYLHYTLATHWYVLNFVSVTVMCSNTTVGERTCKLLKEDEESQSGGFAEDCHSQGDIKKL